MELNVKHIGNRVRFEIAGIIDRQGAEVLKKNFGKLDISSVKELVLDFGKVRYIGGSGVGKLLMFYKKMKTNGGKLHIENDPGIFHELLTITKTDTVFSFYRNG